MGKAAKHWQTTAEAVVYGRFMESPDRGENFQGKVKSPIGMEGKEGAWRSMMRARLERKNVTAFNSLSGRKQ